MKRKPHPHESLVQEIRRLITSQDFSRISDDMDMYTERVGGYSPMLRQEDSNAELRRQAHELAAQLLEIGEPAAEAVALGLRMQGAWRESLLPYARQHLALPAIRDALDLLARRQRDALTREVRRILGKP